MDIFGLSVYILISYLVEVFLILPFVLYLAAKILKVAAEKISYLDCLLIPFVSGLLAGFIYEFNWIAGLIGFAVLWVYPSFSFV